MTPKEALNRIKQYPSYRGSFYKQFTASDEEFDKDVANVEQALTELESIKRYPTADEVCKEIEKFLNTKHKVIFNNKTKLFEIPDWDVYDVLNNTIFGFQNEIQDLPPHLITLIGRFYEGIEKK